jgi:hypothetical protein
MLLIKEKHIFMICNLFLIKKEWSLFLHGFHEMFMLCCSWMTMKWMLGDTYWQDVISLMCKLIVGYACCGGLACAMYKEIQVVDALKMEPNMEANCKSFNANLMKYC